MTVYEMEKDKIQPLQKATFSQLGITERQGLQRLLREKIEVIAPGTLVISEEFGSWDNSLRRIDLLGIDKEANLVVIELKRTEDGGHMDLQALRYASMVSTMTYDQAVTAFSGYLKNLGDDPQTAEERILKFLQWDTPDHDAFAQDVRIILTSADFSLEITTTVLWLNQQGLNIRCVKLQPYHHDNKVLIDVQQIIPVPEAAAYQIRVQQKIRTEREARVTRADYSRYDLQLGDQLFNRQTKRKAIFETFRYLIGKGNDPMTLARLSGKRAERSVHCLDGHFNSAEFIDEARRQSAQNNTTFDSNRWFCNDDELLKIDGKTYVFSNQWGGDDWLNAMNTLYSHFPGHEMSFKPSETEPTL